MAVSFFCENCEKRFVLVPEQEESQEHFILRTTKTLQAPCPKCGQIGKPCRNCSENGKVERFYI